MSAVISTVKRDSAEAECEETATEIIFLKKKEAVVGCSADSELIED
jgi:hypothetical protein